MKELTVGQVIALGAQEEVGTPRVPTLPYRLPERVDDLEAQNAALIRRLETAEERIQALERQAAIYRVQRTPRR